MRKRSILLVALVLLSAQPAPAADPGPYEEIWTLSKELTRRLKRSRSTNAELVPMIRALEAHARALPDESTLPDDERKAVDRLKDHIEKNWMRAVVLVKVPPRLEVNLRLPVQVCAARAIGAARPGIDRRFRKTVERIFKNDRYVCAPILYEALFNALVALDQPRLVEWLLDHGITSRVNPDDQQRTLAAFQALRKMRNVSGKERREVVRKLLAIFQSYAFHWQNEYDAVAGFRSVRQMLKKVAGVATPYWMDVRPFVLDTLRHFSIDPRTGRPPMDKRTGLELQSVPRYLNWFASNQRAGSPPWLDAKEDAAPPEDRTKGRYVPPTIPTLFHKYGISWETWWTYNHDAMQARSLPSSEPADSTKEDAFRAALRTRLVEPLTALIDDESPVVRSAAAVSLAHGNAPGHADRLVALVDSDAPEILREASMLGLMLRAESARAAWFQRHAGDKQENPRVRGYAILALGWLRETPALWKLVRADDRDLGDSQRADEIRACAVLALGLAKEVDAAEPLAAMLKPCRVGPAVLGAVGPALALLEEKAVVPTLLQVLAVRRKQDRLYVAQVSAAHALGFLVKPDDRRTIQILGKRLRMMDGQFGGARSELILSIGRIGGSTALDVLVDGYEDCFKSTMRYAERGFFMLAFALAHCAAGRHRIRLAYAELKHDKDLGAAAAASALASDASLTSLVRGHLDSAGPNYTPFAVAALGRIGHASAAEEVEDVLKKSRDPRLVRHGALALARLKGVDATPALVRLWNRSQGLPHYDMLAWAFHHAPGAAAEAHLLDVANDEHARPNARACAILALGRMAGGATHARTLTIARAFNPYGECATLTGLALYRDAAFLR